MQRLRGSEYAHKRLVSIFDFPLSKSIRYTCPLTLAVQRKSGGARPLFWILRRLKKNIWGDYCSNYLILRLKVSFGGRLVLFSRAGVIFFPVGWPKAGQVALLCLSRLVSPCLNLLFLRRFLPVSIYLLFSRAPGNSLACDSALLTLACFSLCDSAPRKLSLWSTSYVSREMVEGKKSRGREEE